MPRAKTKVAAPAATAQPSTIVTPYGVWPFALNARAMADVQSRLGRFTDAHALIEQYRADPDGLSHQSKLALFVWAGVNEARSHPIDFATAKVITDALGPEGRKVVAAAL